MSDRIETILAALLKELRRQNAVTIYEDQNGGVFIEGRSNLVELATAIARALEREP